VNGDGAARRAARGGGWRRHEDGKGDLIKRLDRYRIDVSGG
jgi:hypothetical protein